MNRPTKSPAVMAFGVGAFTQGVLRVLREDGADVSTYLTRSYAHYPPSLEGPTFSAAEFPNPCPLLAKRQIDFVLPQSIDWAQQPWTDELLARGVPILCPTGEALRLERERDCARQLCEKFDIPFPKAFFARDPQEAEEILRRHPRGYAIKNPLCSPTSPIHTIVCETVEDTRGWLEQVDYAEGVFLQEYLGRREAGHFAFVSGGEIYSLVTNQEYKRAFNGNMGIVAGAPLGGLVERDPFDKYGLARELLRPLLPWFRETNFHGPVQVTAIRYKSRWHVLEYNVRLGVTSGPMILRMLERPTHTLWHVARNTKLKLRFRPGMKFGCSLTLAGYGYPYVKISGPRLPVDVQGELDCDVCWNEVEAGPDGRLLATGHRIADVVALDRSLQRAIQRAYANIRKIRCVGSYYRTDIGQSLWPPGED